MASSAINDQIPTRPEDSATSKPLPAIQETVLSSEDRTNLRIVAPDLTVPNTRLQEGLAKAIPDPEARDELLEQLNVIAIKMDFHKTGTFYLKESV